MTCLDTKRIFNRHWSCIIAASAPGSRGFKVTAQYSRDRSACLLTPICSTAETVLFACSLRCAVQPRPFCLPTHSDMQYSRDRSVCLLTPICTTAETVLFACSLRYAVQPRPFCLPAHSDKQYSRDRSVCLLTTICSVLFRYYLVLQCILHSFIQSRKETKLRIHNITATAALKFGSEAWVLKKRKVQRLEAAQVKFLRHWLGITKLDKEKTKKTAAHNIVNEIKQDQKKWLQHVQRMDTNRIAKEALHYRPKGRWNIERQKRWRDQLHFEDQGTGNTPNIMMMIIQSRFIFKKKPCHYFKSSTSWTLPIAFVTMLLH